MARASRYKIALISPFIVALWVLVSSQPAAAAPGDVDPSFGFAGRVLSTFQQASAEILALAIQPDGKIIAVGNAESSPGFGLQGTRHLLISRHSVNGAPDTSFSSGGKTITTFSVGPSSAQAVALQSDGKIVVAGRAGDFFALARYNSDGSLDQSFGSGGQIATRFEPDNPNTLSLASSLAVQSDGKIVVAGDSFLRNPAAPWFVTNCNVGLARFTIDGVLDQTFGAGGLVVSDLGNFDRADALALQSDGKIIIAGDSNATGTGPYTAHLLRYNTDGTPDETFGISGEGAAITGSFDVAAMSLQTDGKIIVGGTFLSASPAFSDFAVARYNADGSLDSGFGVAGLAVTDFAWTSSAAGRQNAAATVALQQDGKIVLGGYSTGTFALARYHSDGNVDAAFGDAGIVTTQISSLGSTTFSFPVAASSNFSSITISAQGGFGGTLGLHCPLFPFQSCGVDLNLFLVEQAFALALQPNGKIIAGGVLDKQAALVRYHSVMTPKITVANTGAGLGAVWSPDGAISCGTRCSASYDAGSTVLVGWATAFGSYFAGWNGCTPVAGGGCALTLNADATVTADFDLDLPITADASSLPGGAVGISYITQIGLMGRHPFSSRVTSGSLPAGLALDGRMLSGTPSRAGRSRFTLEFTDANGEQSRKNFSLTVAKPLSFSTRNLKSGRPGRAYSATLKTIGGEGPYTWSLLSGTLPAGFSLDGVTGRIAGLPTATGTYDLTIRVADVFGQHIDRSFTLNIQ